ncbi:hypothetical protein [Capnocytophaga leadbetteri]|uniref:hypothetical protein n=1 Tax=Capnocytophaga leadbetteri TaxID=327575 RepID=UPI0028E79915|nr:hypothetical protein [Capnocytophaga leadbetteri]
MKAKHLIIGGVAVLAIGLMSFTRARISQGKELFKRILFKVSLPKRFDISTQRMRFYVDLILQNPTAQDFSASSAGSIAAKSYRVYVGNKLLAFGSLGSISGVTLPAGGSYTFPNIYVEIPTIELLKHAYSLTGEADNWKKLFAGKSAQQPNGTTSLNDFTNVVKANAVTFMRDLRYELDVEIFGITYLFKQNVF